MRDHSLLGGDLNASLVSIDDATRTWVARHEGHATLQVHGDRNALHSDLALTRGLLARQLAARIGRNPPFPVSTSTGTC